MNCARGLRIVSLEEHHATGVIRGNGRENGQSEAEVREGSTAQGGQPFGYISFKSMLNRSFSCVGQGAFLSAL